MKGIWTVHELSLGFPGGTVVKNLPANAGDIRDMDSTPGSVKAPGEGNSYPLQYSCLENSMDRGAWLGIVHGVAKSLTRLNTHTHTHVLSLQLFCEFKINPK